jgi:hypothetical protein
MELSKNPHPTKDHILPKAPIEFAGLQNDHCVEVEYAFRHD